MKIKISEAVGPVLDWMVAKCEGGYDLQLRSTYGAKTAWQYTMRDEEDNLRMDKFYLADTSYSTDWTLGGPILQHHISELIDCADDGWEACCNGTYGATGNTALEAVCKAYVASKLGDEVEVPDGLA